MDTDELTPQPEPPEEDQPPGSSLDLIIGALGTDPTIPPDLASRHHDHLYSVPDSPQE
jgi:hypothetical protein